MSRQRIAQNCAGIAPELRQTRHLEQLLVGRRLVGEQREAQQHLGDDAAERPHVDSDRVLGGAEEELGRAVEERADVEDVRLARDEALRAPEVAELQLVRARVAEHVVGLQVAVGDAGVVDVAQRLEQLPHQDLEEQRREAALLLQDPRLQRAQRARHEVHHEVEPRAVALVRREPVAQPHDVLVRELLHHRQLAVLVPLVERDALDRARLARLALDRAPHRAERAVPDGLGDDVAVVPDEAAVEGGRHRGYAGRCAARIGKKRGATRRRKLPGLDRRWQTWAAKKNNDEDDARPHTTRTP